MQVAAEYRRIPPPPQKEPVKTSAAETYRVDPSTDVESVRNAMRTTMDSAEAAAALQYGATEGYPPMRRHLAARQFAQGVPDARPEHAIVTADSVQSVELLAKTLVDPGDRVIVDPATPDNIIASLELYGAHVVRAPADAEGPKFNSLENLIVQHKPKFVYLMPDGDAQGHRAMGEERRRAMVMLAARHQVRMVEDYPCERPGTDHRVPTLLALSQGLGSTRDLVAQCGTLHGVESGGLSVGWLTAQPTLLAKTAALKGFADTATPTFTQALLAHVLDQGGPPPGTYRVRTDFDPGTRQPRDTQPVVFANRAARMQASAIRELFKLLGDKRIISFAGGFPDPDLFDKKGVAAACEKVLDQQSVEALGPVDVHGYQRLRENLARFMLDFKNVQGVRPEDVLVTTGSQEAIDLICKMTKPPEVVASGKIEQPGDTLDPDGVVRRREVVVVELPTFLAAVSAFTLYGAKVVVVPLDPTGVRTKDLAQIFQEYGPKAFYTIATYGNPSGVTALPEVRRRVLELLVEYGVLGVEDDPYGALRFTQEPAPPSLLALTDEVMGSREKLIHLGSLSKVMCPGLRVGWMVAPPEFIEAAAQLKFSMPDALTQAVAAQYLEDGAMASHMEAVRHQYASRAELMCRLLKEELGPAIEFTRPDGGLFVWARLTGANGCRNDVAQLALDCAARGVAFVPGAPFDAREKPAQDTLRFSFAMVGEKKIDEGIRLFARIVRGEKVPVLPPLQAGA